MSNILPSRILAVEVRSARFGYALFEKPRRLIDFGATGFDSPVTARLRIRRLLRFSHPTLLVLRKKDRSKATPAKTIARIIRKEAKGYSVPVRCITDRSFKKYYDSHSRRTKYDRAVLLATVFPEIAWRLPPRRKFYEPEPLAMIYFDSIALGMMDLELMRRLDRTILRTQFGD